MRNVLILLLPLCLLLAGTVSAAPAAEFAGALTDEELAYLDSAPTLTVIFSPNKGPLQYLDDQGDLHGVSRDLLDQIAALTGLTFDYTVISGMGNMAQALQSGQAQLLAGIPPEQEVRQALAVDFSQPYMDCSYGLLLNRGTSLDQMEHLRLALAEGLDPPQLFRSVREIVRRDTIQQTIDAVRTGQADLVYGNAYVLEFYAQGYLYQNLCVVPLNGLKQTICFGVSQQMPQPLLSILDKAIDHLGPDGIGKIIVNNVAASTQPVTLASWISMNPTASVVAAGLILGLLALAAGLFLLSSRRRTQLLRLEHQRYLRLSEAAREYFYEYEIPSDTLRLNEDTAALFGVRPVIRKWRTYLHNNSILSPDTRHLLEEQYQPPGPSHEASQDSQELQLELPLPDGGKRWFRLTRLTLFERDRPAFHIGKLTDIQEERQAYHELVQKAVTDSMTGVYNGTAAKELIDCAIPAMLNGVFFMVDLDRFKQVNDRFGHATGDQVIKALASILQETFRRGDIIGRVGGDEFIVFAQNTADETFIAHKCQQLREKVGAIHLAPDYRQTLSIGIAKMERPCSYEQLFQQADAALYFVKKNGRDGFHVFS